MRRKLFWYAVAYLPGVLKLWLYRIVGGARIGPGVVIGFGARLLVDDLTLGEGTQIGAHATLIARRATTGVRARIGQRSRIVAHSVSLASRSTIGDDVIVAGRPDDPESRLSLGREAWVFPFCYIDVECAVTLGRNVGVGGGSYMFTHGYWLSLLDGFPSGRGPITIRDDTWLPWSCFIMPGVTIGSHVVVGARSLVSGDVPDHALVAGTPAKVIRERSSRPVTDEARLDMLTQLTRDFATQRGAQCSVDVGSDGTRTLVVARALTIKLWPRETSAAALMAAAAAEPQQLHILLDAIPEQLHRRIPLLSIATYEASSAGLLGTEALRWLDFGRRIGLRFYPWDEA